MWGLLRLGKPPLCWAAFGSSPAAMDSRGLSLQPFHIPMSCRQPRSQGCRPRPPRGWKDGCPITITSTCDVVTHNPVSTQVEEDIFAVECHISLDAGHLQLAEDESAADNSLSAAYNSGCTSQHTSVRVYSNLTAEPSSATPTESTLNVTGSVNSCIAPGSVVWAKTGYHEWWPAEVIDRRAALDCSPDERDERLVLIQLYGVYEYAWVDPVRNLSQFDYCYEERSKDTSKAFQDALNQALRRKETASSSEQSDENSEKWNALGCCGTNEGPINEGKGKRKRTPKVYFDDMTFPDNSVRKMRRMKIMRHLGLTAPVGSPFSRPLVRRRS